MQASCMYPKSALISENPYLLVVTQRMMNMVETVANDPLSPLQFDHSDSGGYETRLLESTIEKLTGLLRVGFGEVRLAST